MRLIVPIFSFFIILTLQSTENAVCSPFIQERFFQNIKYLQIGQGTHAIICFHGLGDHAHAGYAQLFQDMKDITLFIPEMPYSTTFLNNKCGAISMGGSTDTKAALSFVQHVIQLGYNKIGLYGFSCGAAVVVQLIGLLQNRCLHNNILKQLNIDVSQANQLRKSIRVCILDRPFINFEYTMAALVGSSVAYIAKLCALDKRIGLLILKRNFPGNTIMLDAAPIFDVADTINHMPFLMYAAKQDKVVGYHGVVQLYNHLQTRGADVMFLQADGNHVSSIPKREVKKVINFVSKWLYSI